MDQLATVCPAEVRTAPLLIQPEYLFLAHGKEKLCRASALPDALCFRGVIKLIAKDLEFFVEEKSMEYFDAKIKRWMPQVNPMIHYRVRTRGLRTFSEKKLFLPCEGNTLLIILK